MDTGIDGKYTFSVEVNKNSGAHQKNFNEDRPISLLGKCRPMYLFVINIKCMQMCVGVPSEKVYLPPIPVSIFPDCTCFHFVAYFPAHRERQQLDNAAGAGARPPWRAPAQPSRLLLGWPMGWLGCSSFETKVSGRRRIGLNVQCSAQIYYISGAFLLRIRDGSISVFWQNWYDIDIFTENIGN